MTVSRVLFVLSPARKGSTTLRVPRVRPVHPDRAGHRETFQERAARAALYGQRSGTVEPG